MHSLRRKRAEPGLRTEPRLFRACWAAEGCYRVDYFVAKFPRSCAVYGNKARREGRDAIGEAAEVLVDLLAGKLAPAAASEVGRIVYLGGLLGALPTAMRTAYYWGREPAGDRSELRADRDDVHEPSSTSCVAVVLGACFLTTSHPGRPSTIT